MLHKSFGEGLLFFRLVVTVLSELFIAVRYYYTPVLVLSFILFVGVIANLVEVSFVSFSVYSL